MQDSIVKILFTLFGLYAGVMSWLFKTAWNDVQQLKKELSEIQANCTKCQTETLESIRELIDERFDKFMITVEQKLEQGFTKIELSWVNEGRISPKKTKKDA